MAENTPPRKLRGPLRFERQAAVESGEAFARNWFQNRPQYTSTGEFDVNHLPDGQLIENGAMGRKYRSLGGKYFDNVAGFYSHNEDPAKRSVYINDGLAQHYSPRNKLELFSSVANHEQTHAIQYATEAKVIKPAEQRSMYDKFIGTTGNVLKQVPTFLKESVANGPTAAKAAASKRINSAEQYDQVHWDNTHRPTYAQNPIEASYNIIENTPNRIKDEYLTQPQEVHARIMQFRQAGGLKPDQVVTPAVYKEARKRMSSKVDSGAISDLDKMYNEKDLIMLLNKTADNDEVSQEGMEKMLEPGERQAAYGGENPYPYRYTPQGVVQVNPDANNFSGVDVNQMGMGMEGMPLTQNNADHMNSRTGYQLGFNPKNAQLVQGATAGLGLITDMIERSKGKQDNLLKQVQSGSTDGKYSPVAGSMSNGAFGDYTLNPGVTNNFRPQGEYKLYEEGGENEYTEDPRKPGKRYPDRVNQQHNTYIDKADPHYKGDEGVAKFIPSVQPTYRDSVELWNYGVKMNKAFDAARRDPNATRGVQADGSWGDIQAMIFDSEQTVHNNAIKPAMRMGIPGVMRNEADMQDYQGATPGLPVPAYFKPKQRGLKNMFAPRPLKYQEGGEYELSQEEIDELIRQGYEVDTL